MVTMTTTTLLYTREDGLQVVYVMNSDSQTAIVTVVCAILQQSFCYLHQQQKQCKLRWWQVSRRTRVAGICTKRWTRKMSISQVDGTWNARHYSCMALTYSDWKWQDNLTGQWYLELIEFVSRIACRGTHMLVTCIWYKTDRPNLLRFASRYIDY